MYDLLGFKCIIVAPLRDGTILLFGFESIGSHIVCWVPA